MDAQLRKEMAIRTRVESIFNKRESDFASKAEHDDYLEEREDVVFNLAEGTAVAEMEARIEAYRAANAESIARNEAQSAEESRAAAAAAAERAAAAAAAAAPAAVAAAAEDGGGAAAAAAAEPAADAGMAYLAKSQPAAGVAPGRLAVPLAPIALGAGGDLPAPAVAGQTRAQWEAMAAASGWTPEMPRRKAAAAALGSLLLDLEGVTLKAAPAGGGGGGVGP